MPGSFFFDLTVVVEMLNFYHLRHPKLFIYYPLYIGTIFIL